MNTADPSHRPKIVQLGLAFERRLDIKNRNYNE